VDKAKDFMMRVWKEWNEDKVTRLAASLSYYTVFSLAPLLVIIIAVAGLLFGADVAQRQIVAQMQGLVGAEGAELVDGLLNNARNTDANWLATLLGLATIVLGATGVVGELKDALNTIWNVTPKPGNGLFATFFERALSLGMVLAIGFLLLVSLVVSAGLTAVNEAVRGYVEQWVIVAQLLDLAISLGAVTLLFALLFKFLPDARVAWRDVWIGAAVTAVLFTLGKFLLGVYLGNSNLATPFGAAGSLVILFVWVYYAAQILFLGAEVTQVYANLFGSGVRPKSDAETLSDAARVAEGSRKPDAATPDAATPGATTPGALKPGATMPASQPLYLEMPRRTYMTRGPFEPLVWLGGALGTILFGGLARLLGRGAHRRLTHGGGAE
jgi:membrane protein